MDKVQQSILAQGIVEARVIPNGVNLAIFHPGDRDAARHRIGLPRDALILLASATDLKNNPWKDYITLEKAVAQVAGIEAQHHVILLVLGNKSPTEQHGKLEIRFIPFLENRTEVAMYYQASDLVVHAAKAEVFGLVIVEALACGIPVVATAVGGIPDLIVHGKTGLLVPPGDAVSLVHAIRILADNADLRKAMGSSAAEDAALRFDERTMVSAYCGWYEEIHERQRTVSPGK
jgi:glycosyltransferase involved in cell wall biosynthesis